MDVLHKMITFDPSTRSTGFAVFENSVLSFSGAIKHSDRNRESRYDYMTYDIDALLDREEPDLVLMESTCKEGKPYMTFSPTIRIQKDIKRWCKRKGIPIILYSPEEWRRPLNIQERNRKLLKERAIEIAKKYTKYTPGDDEAEAVCIGLSYLTDKKMEEK